MLENLLPLVYLPYQLPGRRKVFLTQIRGQPQSTGAWIWHYEGHITLECDWSEWLLSPQEETGFVLVPLHEKMVSVGLMLIHTSVKEMYYIGLSVVSMASSLFLLQILNLWWCHPTGLWVFFQRFIYIFLSDLCYMQWALVPLQLSQLFNQPVPLHPVSGPGSQASILPPTPSACLANPSWGSGRITMWHL